MPYFSLTTAQVLAPEVETRVIQEAGKAVKDVLGKSEEYLISVIRPASRVELGVEVSPAAWVEFKTLGLSPDSIPDLVARFSELVSRETGIPEEQIYTVCEDVPRTHWAKGRKTFG